MQDDNKIRYVHFRFFNPFTGDVEGRGGVTYAYRNNPFGEGVQYAFARCSEKDNYSKEMGRAIASERLDIDGKNWTKETDTLQTFANNLSDWLEFNYQTQGVPIARKYSRKNRRNHTKEELANAH